MKLDKVKMYGRYLSEFLLPDQIQILEKEVIKLFKEQNEAINNTPCCKSDSELLICLDCGNYEMLTNYKLYPLVSESKVYYNLYDDNNKLVQMSKVRFKKATAN